MLGATYGKYLPMEPIIQAQSFIYLLNLGWVVDGRCGGLVIGRSHAEGDIYMIHSLEDGNFAFAGVMEGGEYILTNKAYCSCGERLTEINSNPGVRKVESIELREEQKRIINTSSEPTDKFLWVDKNGQFIVNKKSTQIHLDELHLTNHRYQPFDNVNLNELVLREIT